MECSRARDDLHPFPTRRSSDLEPLRRRPHRALGIARLEREHAEHIVARHQRRPYHPGGLRRPSAEPGPGRDRKSTRLNSSHLGISYAVFCLKKKKQKNTTSPAS